MSCQLLCCLLDRTDLWREMELFDVDRVFVGSGTDRDGDHGGGDKH